MPQYLKFLGAVPFGLSVFTISVSNCRFFPDINVSHGSVATRDFIVNCRVATLLCDYYKLIT